MNKLYSYLEPVYNPRGIECDSRRVVLSTEEILMIHWPEWSYQQYRIHGFHAKLNEEDCINDFIQRNNAIPTISNDRQC